MSYAIIQIIGPGLGRNLALDKVNEGFVGFLDADDEIIPDNYYKAFKEGFLKGADWITFNGWTEKNVPMELRWAEKSEQLPTNNYLQMIPKPSAY